MTFDGPVRFPTIRIAALGIGLTLYTSLFVNMAEATVATNGAEVDKAKLAQAEDSDLDNVSTRLVRGFLLKHID